MGVVKNVIKFGVDNNSSTHNDNRNKDIWILCSASMQGLDDTISTVQTE